VPGAGPIRGASGVGQVITDMLERVAGGGSVTVSCALRSRDGPRSVELASHNASGPPITAGLSDTDATRIPVTSTSTPRREDRQRRVTRPHLLHRRCGTTEANDLGNPVDTRMLSGRGIWRRGRLHWRSEQVSTRGVDALFGRCRRCTGPGRGGRCSRGGGGRRRGFGCLFFLGASGCYRAHRDDRGNARNGRESTTHET